MLDFGWIQLLIGDLVVNFSHTFIVFLQYTDSSQQEAFDTMILVIRRFLEPLIPARVLPSTIPHLNSLYMKVIISASL